MAVGLLIGVSARLPNAEIPPVLMLHTNTYFKEVYKFTKLLFSETQYFFINIERAEGDDAGY